MKYTKVSLLSINFYHKIINFYIMCSLIKASDLDQSRLYRITNEEECHNGFKYQTGDNIDILEFNPNDTCQPGGLYFFDIALFLIAHST